MRISEKERLAMFRRIRDLLSAGPDIPAVAAPRAELDAVIERLSTLGARQDEHHRRMRALTVTLQSQARLLRTDLMRPVALAARAIPNASIDEAEAFRKSVRMQLGGKDYEALIVAARGMAAAVEEHTARFVAAGLSADFVTRLRAGADAVTAAIGARARERQRRVASTEGLATDVLRGAAVVRLIDALMQPVLRSDPARQAEWNAAIRWSRPTAAPATIEIMEQRAA